MALPKVREITAGQVREALAAMAEADGLDVRPVALLEDAVNPLPDHLLDLVVEGGAAALDSLGYSDAVAVLREVRRINAPFLADLPTAIERLESAFRALQGPSTGSSAPSRGPGTPTSSTTPGATS